MNERTILSIGNDRISRATCNLGGEWQVSTSLAGKDPRTLAADPNHPGTVFAGTQGNGVFRSDDSGLTWSASGLDGYVVKSLVVSPHDSNVIYAGTKPAAIHASSDGGRTWTELRGFRRVPNRWWWWSPAEPPFRAYVNAITVSPSDPNIVLAGVELGATVRSADGGQTWSGHLQGAIRDCHWLSFHVGDGNWVYEAGGTGGGSSVSRDSGRSWRQVTAGLAAHYGITCAADPQQPEIWYVAVAPNPRKAYSETGECYLYRASAGSDWQPIGWAPHPLRDAPNVLVTTRSAPGHLYAGTRGGKIWHSADYGDSWERLPFELDSIWHSMIVI